MDAPTSQNGSRDMMGIIPPPIPGYHEKYPQWIGHKFAPNGTVLPFPGHGVISHLSVQSPMHAALQKLREELGNQDFGQSLVFLPPTTYHMTIYEGVSDKIRRRDCWPAELPLDCSLAECTQFVADKLQKFDIDDAISFRMSVVGWWPLEDGFAVRLVGADGIEEQKLRRLRDGLAKVFQLRHPNFDEYSFHIGMSYKLRLDDEQTSRRIEGYMRDALKRLPQEVELGQPEFCTYDNMISFKRQFFLKSSRSSEENGKHEMVKHENIE